MYHSENAASEAEEYFVTAFSRREIPQDIPEFAPVWEKFLDDYETLESFIARIGLATSKSDARRKIEQGGVSIDGERVVAGIVILSRELHDGKVLKVGKRGFVRIKF
ncbi:MAG: hypothetical protein HGB34_04110 [Candidatus Moranbacteria bacterium]|nr:hypothetical protein [Candidatus Moranbacteria bacterium]